MCGVILILLAVYFAAGHCGRSVRFCEWRRALKSFACAAVLIGVGAWILSNEWQMHIDRTGNTISIFWFGLILAIAGSCVSSAYSYVHPRAHKRELKW